MSEFLNLNGKDLFKGLIVAVIMAVLGSLQTIIADGSFPTADEWITIGKMAGSAIVSYLLKNLFTNSKDEPFKVEP